MEFQQKKIGKKRSLTRHLLIGALSLALVASVAVEVTYQYFTHKAASDNSETLAFVIKPSESAQEVASNLFEDRLIVSKWAFLRYADKHGFAERFQAGRFYIPKNITIVDLTEKLTNAKPEEITVTIPEGSTNDDIDRLLTKLQLIEPGEFVQCVASCTFTQFPFLPQDPALREGFFFPDSYFVNPDTFAIQEFAIRLVSTFDQKTKAIFGTAKRNGWDILKMASIIEKESRKGDERPIVAAILWNRFDAKQLIGADATTRYAVKKPTGELTVEELQDKNPWNTRAVVGLPPGAISNPGLEAIEAAANSPQTEYWYYLHDSQGVIHYATTLEEHNANKAKFL